MNDRLVNTSIRILRLLPASGLHTNAIIKQTSPDRTHVIEAIRFLQSGKMVRADERNWKFGQKKTIIPTELGFEIRTLMEDLDRYNDAYSKFRQTQERFDELANTSSSVTINNDGSIEVFCRSGRHKVKDESEADNLIMRAESATRSKFKSMGWTNDEIELGNDVSYGLSLVNTFCDRNIFSALGHRYVFTFYRFDLDKNEIAGNILTEVIANELKRQLSNLLSEKFKKGSEREEGDDSINTMYYIMYNQIVTPVLLDLEDVLDIERYGGGEMENKKKICHSLLFNRFVSSDVKNVVSSLLRVLHHYTKENTTSTIDLIRTLERTNCMSGINNIDKILRSNRRISTNKKLELEVAKEYNSMLEHWFRKDNEGESDKNSLLRSIRHWTTPDQTDGSLSDLDKNNDGNGILV
jgi:hypothetical protein